MLSQFIRILILFGLWGQQTWAQDSIRIIVSEQGGTPVEGVTVLVGTGPDQPFVQNWKKTDSKGIVEFQTLSLDDQPITLSKAGYPRITYFNQFGMDFQLKLPPPSRFQKIEVSGELTGFDNTKLGRLGLFVPFFTSDKLFQFAITDLISPIDDQFSVLGKDLYLPSNVTLPKQTHWVGVVPVTLNKPKFHIPVFVPDTHHFIGVGGTFPFDKVKDTLSSDTGTLFDIINDVKFDRLHYVTDQYLTSPRTYNLDLGLTRLKQCLRVSAKNFPSQLRVVSFSLLRFPQSYGQPYMPMDLKALDQGAQGISCIENDTRPFNVMNLAFNFKKVNNQTFFEKGMSSIISRNIPRGPMTPGLLEHKSFFSVPDVAVTNQGSEVAVSRPERPGISPTASALFAVLSDVQITPTANGVVEESHPKWVVFASSKTSYFKLPQLPVDAQKESVLIAPVRVDTKRWEIAWLGLETRHQFDKSQLRSVNLGYDLFEAMTHASRNAQDF
ncbi:MAG: hypothetical protein IT289_10435 [Oligoflexia bacterium]|nr:hypothetical protein [Oligoflexia bacterium]